MPHTGWLALLLLVVVAGMVSRPLAVVLAVGFVLWEHAIPRVVARMHARRHPEVRPRA